MTKKKECEEAEEGGRGGGAEGQTKRAAAGGGVSSALDGARRQGREKRFCVLFRACQPFRPISPSEIAPLASRLQRPRLYCRHRQRHLAWWLLLLPTMAAHESPLSLLGNFL